MPCASYVLPKNDAVLEDSVITLTQTAGTGSVRVFGVRPAAVAPFDDDWVEVPLGANLRDDYYLSTGPYSTFDCYVEGLTAGPVELTLTYSRGDALCQDKVLLNVVEYRVVELRYKTFIACNAIDTTPWSPIIDIFRGDDRGFGYVGSPSRSFQSYYVTVGPTIPDGPVIDVATNHYFGTTYGYNNRPANVGPCPPGQVCPIYCANCLLPGATAQCIQTAQEGQDGNVLSAAFERLNAAEGKIRLDLIGKNPCVALAPAIDAHIIFVFRQPYNAKTGVLGPMEWRVDPSWHDEFPWHEMYLNGVQVYTFDPCIHPGGPDPEGLFDVDGGFHSTAEDAKGDSDIDLPFDRQPQNPNIGEWQEVP